ncbi:MAG: hypothetical protein ACOYMV_08070 [Verrucomicrobiia bacterium]
MKRTPLYLAVLGILAWIAFLIERDREDERIVRTAAGESEAERRRR